MLHAISTIMAADAFENNVSSAVAVVSSARADQHRHTLSSVAHSMLHAISAIMAADAFENNVSSAVAGVSSARADQQVSEYAINKCIFRGYEIYIVRFEYCTCATRTSANPVTAMHLFRV
jgi:hypothetical protein